MRIDGRTIVTFKTTKLARSRNIELQSVVVDKEQNDSDDHKNWSGNANDQNCTGDIGQTHQEIAEIHGQHGINNVNVFAEPVQNTTQRSCVEKGHRGSQNLMQHRSVQMLRCSQTTKNQADQSNCK